MLGWDNSIGYLFHDVARFRSVVYDYFMQPHGLTRAQWRVLGALLSKDGLSQRELCDRIEIGAVTLSGLIDRLEAHGWVERREDLDDRRVKRVWRTERVKEIQDIMECRSNGLNKMALKGLSPKQIQQLVNMLELVKSNLVSAVEEIQENKNGPSQRS